MASSRAHCSMVICEPHLRSLSRMAVPEAAQNRLANCSIEAHGGLSPAKGLLLRRRWLREARAPACKKGEHHAIFQFNCYANIAKRRKFVAGLRLAALSFAIFTIGASGALAQGVPSLPSAGSDRTSAADPERSSARRPQGRATSGAPSQPASASPQSERLAGRTEASVRPHFRSGRAVKRPGPGALFSAATKRPVLPTRPMHKTRSS